MFPNDSQPIHLTNELILCILITRGRVHFNGYSTVKSPFWHQVLNLCPSDPKFLRLAAVPSSKDFGHFHLSNKVHLNSTLYFRIHTGAKPYGCSLCGYRCNRSYNVHAHLRKVHQIAKPNLKTDIVVFEDDLKNEDEKFQDVVQAQNIEATMAIV